MDTQRKRRSDAGTRRTNNPPDQTFTFKLNASNPDEKAAMDVIGENRELGLRKLFTIALLNFDGQTTQMGVDVQSLELDELTARFHNELEYLEQIINQLSSSGASLAPSKAGKSKKQSNISLGYLANLKQALRSSEDQE